MKKVTKQLKVIQASSLVMFTKLHNYHWNIKGMDFFPIHEMTEKIYNEFHTLYDDTAERVLQLNDKPLILFKDYENFSVIQEDKNSDFDSRYVITHILTDYQTLLKEFRKLSKVADGASDSTTVAFADEHIANLEKNIWMLKATLS